MTLINVGLLQGGTAPASFQANLLPRLIIDAEIMSTSKEKVSIKLFNPSFLPESSNFGIHYLQMFFSTHQIPNPFESRIRPPQL